MSATNRWLLPALVLAVLTSCTPGVTSSVFRDPRMDFAAVRTVGVMPFQNLSRDTAAAGRVRDVFINRLLSTGALYVLPAGEVARAIGRLELRSTADLAPEEIVKLSGLLKTEAIITGVVREYGEVRSGSSVSNVVSISVQMLEAQTGRIVWTAAATRGGIGVVDRLIGGGGRPMNDVTREAVEDVIRTLFQ